MLLYVPGLPQKSLPVFSILWENRWSKFGIFGYTNGQKTQFLMDFGQNEGIWVERKKIRLNLAVLSSTALFGLVFSILIFGTPGKNKKDRYLYCASNPALNIAIM